MSVSQQKNGRWRAFVKLGRTTVASKTFDRKSDANRWHDTEKLKLSFGDHIDPRAGKIALGDALATWLAEREGSVATSTLMADRECVNRLSKALLGRPLNTLRPSDWDAFYSDQLRSRSRGTVTRTRDTLSAFNTWAVRTNLVTRNAVRESRVPKGTGSEVKTEIYPFTYDELVASVEDVRAMCVDKDAADMLLVLGTTGLRWGELCALRVRDVQRLPILALRVARSKSDGRPLRTTTKGGKVRTVPLLDDVASVIESRLGGAPDDLIFPNERGTFRELANFKRATHWNKYGRGRRIHDMRHSAATIWLTHGVDIKTVQAWMGHSSAKVTLDVYSHWMGSDADTAAVNRLNTALAGHAGGTPVRKLRVAK
jgi:integrase